MILKPRPFRKPNLGKLLARGLAGYWPGVMGTGRTAFDMSGNNNDGTFMDDVSWVGGRDGYAFFFPGASDDYIQLAEIGKLNFSSAFTLILEIYPTGIADDRIFTRYYDGSNRSYDLIVDIASTRLKFVYSTNGATTTTVYSDIDSLVTNKWQRIALTFQYPGNYNFYVNEIPVGSGATVGAIFNNNMIPKIGIAYNLLKDYHGLMSNIVAYTRSLSITEIAQWRNPLCLFERDPIELWPTYEGEEEPPPVGNPGIMTTNTGYWGQTF